MKKMVLTLFLLAVLLVGLAAVQWTAAQDEPLAPDGQPGETYLAPFPVTITLDGDLSDWAGVPTVALTRDDVGVTFAAAADDQNLYLMADVLDTNVIAGQHDADYWNEDSVEFYLNAAGDLTLTSYVPGVAQLTISPVNIDLPMDQHILAGVQGDTVGATFDVIKTDTGWATEVAVPLKNDVWDIVPEHGGEIGFQVHLNGASELNRDTKLIWSLYDMSDQSYQNPSLFGRLRFFEIGGEPLPPIESAVTIEETEPTPVPAAAQAGGPLPDYKKAALPVDERVEDLLSRMSLDEKIGQMTLVEKNSLRDGDITALSLGGVLSGGGGYPSTNTPEAWAEMVNGFQDQALQSALGIPIIYGVDAVHGHNNVKGAVIFPHNVGLGAANDPDLMTRIGQATANEMIATGIYWNYAPMIAVPQDIRWGRAYEAYGENTDLVTALGTAYLVGLQGDDLANPLTVLATPKHYIGDGGTTWGTSTSGNYQIDQGDMQVDEATLRERYLPPYQAAIDAGAQSVMVSFSSWNGTKLHAEKYLVTDVLKGELGFTGFVVSDWGGIDQIDQDYYTAVVTAINAGVDMNMVPYDYNRFITVMKQAVDSGDISEDRIDDAVRRILRVKFELGLFEEPYSHDELLPFVGGDEHRALAREAVGKSLTLLKNDGDLLPLDGAAGPIYVGGAAADDIGIQSGGWTIEWQGNPGDITTGTTILEAIQNTASAEVEYSADGTFDGQAPVCIGVVGERPYAEGVGDDPDLVLPQADLDMLAAMRGSCDKLAVVMITGRPLIVTDEIANWDALLVAWLPGTEGQGVADGLFGLRGITGKLSYTWPQSVDQLPLGTGEGDPLFPFGFGLETEAVPVVVTEQPPLVAADFEGEIVAGTDENGNGIGDVPWGDTSGNVVIEGVPAEGDLALPDQAGEDQILKITTDIASWGGFSHLFNDGTTWLTQDWSPYTDLTFWLYGANSGGQIQVEIFDNRSPGSTVDDAERWFYRVDDNFTGWQFFTIPFADFQRRTDWQPGGAPDDGLGLTEVNGFAFGFPVGANVYYLDNVIVSGTAGLSAPLVAADFEGEIVSGTDENSNGIGDVPWGDTSGNVVIEGVPAEGDLALPDQAGEDQLLKITTDIASWGGFSHLFNDGTTWLTQDWSPYTDLTFWLYGANSGAQIQVEIFDNRSSGSTVDDAERWFYRVDDNFTGWQFFSIPFADFQRRTDWQPGGAPDDGLGLTEVNGFAFGFPTGADVYYLDNVIVSGRSSALPKLDNVQVPRPAVTMRPVVTETYNYGAQWELVWSDEFNEEAGTPINSDYWTCEIGGQGWGNQEWEYYTDRTENVVQDGEGNLSIIARAETLPGSECWYGECTHTSARCITMDKFSFTYGRVEARLKLPYGQGIWPAFWMLGANFADAGWPDSGEVDIMEFIGKEPQTTYGTIHGPGYSGAAGISKAYNWGEDVFNEYHIWSIEWEPGAIRWYVDNLEFFSVTSDDLPPGRTWVYDHDFFILLNLAVGGQWPGYPDETTVFPQTYSIDWVRVFQRTAP